VAGPGSGPARVRIAPSPTGYFHVGTARTALFNWLVARQSEGSFLVRIEDTDAERNREEWVEQILDALRWLGLGWDGEPVRQSQRGALYQEAVDALVGQGALYWCSCTREEVEARRLPGSAPGYDGYCRERGLGPGSGRALRFAVPREGATAFDDVVRGPVRFEHSSIEDFVVVRSSGQVLFILANTVDDMEMGITHVIRGEEHLPNTPKAVLLWEALSRAGRLGRPPLPTFAHLPLLVNERRQKLSKRRDPVALEQYREEGYLPQAMVNYLGLLGWAPRDGRERLELDEMVAEFKLEDVNSSPAYFDVAKLRHFNAERIRAMDTAAFVRACRPFLERAPWGPDAFDEAAFERLAPLVQERVETLGQVPGLVDFVFLDRPEIDEASWAKAVASDPGAAEALAQAAAAYRSCPWTAEEIKEATRRLAERAGRKLARFQAPLRVAVTGRSVGPPLFESMEVLGRGRTIERLEAALDRIGGGQRPR